MQHFLRDGFRSCSWVPVGARLDVARLTYVISAMGRFPTCSFSVGIALRRYVIWTRGGNTRIIGVGCWTCLSKKCRILRPKAEKNAIRQNEFVAAVITARWSRVPLGVGLDFYCE